METTLKNLENSLKKPLKKPGKSLWIFSGHPVQQVYKLVYSTYPVDQNTVYEHQTYYSNSILLKIW